MFYSVVANRHQPNLYMYQVYNMGEAGLGEAGGGVKVGVSARGGGGVDRINIAQRSRYYTRRRRQRKKNREIFRTRGCCVILRTVVHS